MDYGHLTFNIEKILEERNLSKTKVCKDLDIPRSNFNRYCQNKYTRFDERFICKLCHYLDIEVGELITYHRPNDDSKK